MAGLTTKKVVKKQKKHGNKSGRKTSVRPSQKKSVKNGRFQEKETPKVKNVKKAVAAIPAGLDGKILDEDIDAQLDHEAEEEFFGDLPDIDEDYNYDDNDCDELDGDEGLQNNLESEDD